MQIRKMKKNSTYDERGQALVEFALILPFLFLLLFGIIEFGRAFFQKNVTINAAREGARYAAVQATWNAAAIETYTVNTIPVASIRLGATAHVDSPSSTPASGSGVPVTVTVTTTFSTMVPQIFNPLGNKNSISASATMRYEQ